MKKLIIIFLILITASQITAAQPVADYLKISSDINNGYAITTVEEKITNKMNTTTVDEFSFLIPEDAFISGFSLIIDGKEYKADVLSTQEASEKFEEAAAHGRTSGLLEDKKSNLFSYSLSFAPNQSIIVRLTYEQAVKKTLGKYEYLLFLRSTHTINDLSVTMNVSSVNDVLTLETPGFADTDIKYLSTTRGQVTYSATSLPDLDLRVVFTTDNPPVNGDMLFYETANQGYLMHIFSPTEEDLDTTALSKEIIFVIDKSGSMSGEKIEQVKRVFSNIISDLPQDDLFNVIFFDSSEKVYKNMLMEANESTKAEAINFVNGLYANGGTNINDALLRALNMFNPESERVPIIVFLTDGEPTEGVTSPYVIRNNVKEANRVEASIFSIAFGLYGESNYNFLKAMSLENYGTAEQFDPYDNAEEEITGFYETISTTLIKNMDFNYTGDVSDIVNTGKNNLFAGSDAIVLGKYSHGTSTITSEVAATIRTGDRIFTNTFTVDSKPENDFIPRLWAYNTIRDMLDMIDVEGENETLESEVTNLSLEFGFVTPYTSLFVEVPTPATSAEEEEARGESIESKADDVVMESAFESSAPMAMEAPVEMEEYDEPEAEAPGFETISAISGLVSITLLLRWRKSRFE